MKKIKHCLLVVLMGMFSAAQAQYVYDYKHTADVYYNSHDYYSAAQYYNKALGTFKIKPEQILPYTLAGAPAPTGKLKDYQDVVARLAESYRRFYDYGNAETWYAQLVGFNNPAYPQARFWYATCLRYNGKYQQALDEFKKFKQSYTGTDDLVARTSLEIATCEFALSEETKLPRYTLEKTAGNVNEGGANYAPVVIDPGTLMFTSSRPDNPPLPNPATKQKPNAKPNKKGTPYVNNLFTATGSENTFDNSKKISIPTAKGFDQGVSTLSPDGNTMYLTRWFIKDGVKQTSICISLLQNGAWSEPKPLGENVNVAGYNSMQPFITTDGKYLLFASNRPGGMGKYDLWYCIMTNGVPGSARNMGTAINTKDDEQAPFYDSEKNVLVFSTDGRVGYGGLDFFSSEGDFGTWSQPVNMGKPLNSPKDDIYYTALDKAHPFAAGFISSDRESICCLEVFGIKRIKKVISGLIIDCDTQQPLQGATVTLLDTVRRKTISKVTLGPNGRYTFEADPQRYYKIVAEKDNYFTKALYVRTDTLLRIDSLDNPTLCLKHYEVEKPIVLNNIYYDFNKATLREESKVVLDTVVDILNDNPKLTIEMSAHTDSVGSVKYNEKLSQARAQSCVDYLISRGISPTRLIAKGYGKSRPIAPNSLPNGKDNPEGRQLNRRTEFKVLKRQVEVKNEYDTNSSQ
ncbi:WD40-like Beta Propeller Repeat [Chitinophaga terrae (ex Kim and Jung 2007)]|uniref:WD40-like Beta Propeller Repeat n=1 Tax=Chitinophaga terrae (ex Kim and Jung 2007) TaxID=408074 RepID=A0A1H4DX56_9BACT|nr:OmpA family protein [Chitinophaga terrae (ex Kim and Jung 2007)]MDQ0104980.1 outer membrane protein OmpA-like peptidoglycan-associated protein [Chitinophaga terrae (ex Kim and Jung 2007)]SEA77088.1 WD40-like Beta Propeller Repeat [Chitinophaga terrae (ex Kim and Jung 2007)]